MEDGRKNSTASRLRNRDENGFRELHSRLFKFVHFVDLQESESKKNPKGLI